MTAPSREVTNGRPNKGWDDDWEDPIGPGTWPANSVEMEHTASGKVVIKVKVRGDDPDEATRIACDLFDKARAREGLAVPVLSWEGERRETAAEILAASITPMKPVEGEVNGAPQDDF